MTDKTRPDSLHENRIRNIATAISQALSETDLELILSHGAGAYGHIKAKQYRAQEGKHPDFGWQAYYLIRQDMMHLNLRFVQLCSAANLFPVTVQPSAIIVAKDGNINSMDTSIIKNLLEFEQIPLLHGDIVIDENRGFTIASTEDILSFLSNSLQFSRVIMVSDVPGVLDEDGKITPIINRDNYDDIMKHLGDAKGADVTGGMKKKIEHLFSLVRNGNVAEARILSCESDPNGLRKAIKGEVNVGTMII